MGTGAGGGFRAASAAWSPRQRLGGVVPALLAHVVHRAGGTAGGTLVGLFALSALGILTVGWHPLVALRTGSRERGAGPTVTPKTPKKEDDAAPRERKEPLPAPRSLAEKTRKAKSVPPPKPPPVPAGVLIPPIDLLNPAPPEDGDAGLAQIDQMGRKLIETLHTFRVEGAIAGRTVGPVVTPYQVAPGPRVKGQRIASLPDDLPL